MSSRWSRTYDLNRESQPTPSGDSGLQISRGGGAPPLPERRPGAEHGRHHDRIVARPTERQDLPLRELAPLLESQRPQTLADRDNAYRVTGDQVRALATIGAFRAIPADDLVDRSLLSRHELSDLREQGLVHLRTVSLQGESRAIVTLTHDARHLLEAHRETHAEDEPPQQMHSAQQLHSGLVKPGELAHDSHLYALYEVVAADLVAQGATIDRVQLDYELKRDYQSFLNRRDRDPDTTTDDDRRAWAEAHGLTLVDGALHLPDLRIEYTDADGHARVHDVELVTVHYSARTVAAKRSAGFALFRKGAAPRPNLFEKLR